MDGGAPVEPCFKAADKGALQRLIERGGRFVQKADRRILKPEPRPADGLALPLAEPLPAIADLEVEPLGVGFDEGAEPGEIERREKPVVIAFEQRQGEVVAQGAAERRTSCPR